jgi:3',5'-cyclic-AMP phosphodiesterase
VLHITDPHLFAEPDSCLRGTNTRESLQDVLDHILAKGWNADLVALTGDLIQDDTRGAYRRVRDMIDVLRLPVLCVPGNHDIRDLMRDELRDLPYRYCAACKHGNWTIIGIDSCIDGEARGRVAAEELERLDKILATTDADHALICLHHPPLPVGSRWLDTVGLENSREFLDRITASGKVRGAIFGHVHQAFDGEYAGIRIIGTPSTCRQFAVNSDEFALDDNPPAYRRIELQENGSIEDQLVWLEH